jgi:hypothetical protein
MIAIAKRNMIISNINGKSKKGNTLKKDRKIKKGEMLKVIEFYRVNNSVYKGEVVVVEKDNVYLRELKNRFDYEGNKTKKEQIEEKTKPLLDRHQRLSKERDDLGDKNMEIIEKRINEDKKLTQNEKKELHINNEKRARLKKKIDKIWNKYKIKREDLK